MEANNNVQSLYLFSLLDKIHESWLKIHNRIRLRPIITENQINNLSLSDKEKVLLKVDLSIHHSLLHLILAIFLIGTIHFALSRLFHYLLIARVNRMAIFMINEKRISDKKSANIENQLKELKHLLLQSDCNIKNALRKLEDVKELDPINHQINNSPNESDQLNELENVHCLMECPPSYSIIDLVDKHLQDVPEPEQEPRVQLQMELKNNIDITDNEAYKENEKQDESRSCGHVMLELIAIGISMIFIQSLLPTAM